METETPSDFDMEESAYPKFSVTDPLKPFVWSSIAIYCPLEHRFIPGNVSFIKDDGKHVILYDGDDTESITSNE